MSVMLEDLGQHNFGPVGETGDGQGRGELWGRERWVGEGRK